MAKITSIEIGSNIRKIRKSKGLNQNELSELAQIVPTYLSDIENGKVNISVDVFLRIADALKVSADELIGIDTGTEPDPLSEELDKIFFGCSPTESQELLKVLKSVKAAINKVKQEK